MVRTAENSWIWPQLKRVSSIRGSFHLMITIYTAAAAARCDYPLVGSKEGETLIQRPPSDKHLKQTGISSYGN